MVKSLKELQNIDIEQLAKTIEVDAGMPMPELRQALEEARQIGHIEAQKLDRGGHVEREDVDPLGHTSFG